MLQTWFSVIVLAEVSILGQTLWRQLPSIKWALIAHNLHRSLPSQCNSTAHSPHILDLKEAFLFHIKAGYTRVDFGHRGIFWCFAIFPAASVLQGFEVRKSIIVPKGRKTRKMVLQRMHSSPSLVKPKP